jgi:hypothetical protein
MPINGLLNIMETKGPVIGGFNAWRTINVSAGIKQRDNVCRTNFFDV